jgi:hypothetical protein
MDASWTVLEFSWDDVVVCWQDQRLARVSFAAWRAEGAPPEFVINQMAGEGAVCTRWFVNRSAAELLDRRGVDWRRFAVGEGAPPPGAGLAVGGEPRKRCAGRQAGGRPQRV